MDIGKHIDSISLKFKSGNDVEVKDARVTKEEWGALLDAWEDMLIEMKEQGERE